MIQNRLRDKKAHISRGKVQRLMKELGVPISENICPEVTLTGSHCSYGRCCRKGSLKKYNEYEFYIEISGHTLGNTEKSGYNIQRLEGDETYEDQERLEGRL